MPLNQVFENTREILGTGQVGGPGPFFCQRRMGNDDK